MTTEKETTNNNTNEHVNGQPVGQFARIATQSARAFGLKVPSGCGKAAAFAIDNAVKTNWAETINQAKEAVAKDIGRG